MTAVLYKPSAWGDEFHSLPHNEALGAGAAGPGKTTVLIHDPVYQILSEHRRATDRSHPLRIEPGSSPGWALHLRRTLPMLEQTIRKAKRMLTTIDPGGNWTESKLTYTCTSGYTYQFGHCRDSDSWEMYFSSEYTHLAFDELVQFEEEQYEQITGRVRTSDPVLQTMLKVRSMSNPLMKIDDLAVGISVKNPHWVRERFVDPAPLGRTTLARTVRRHDGSEEKITRIYLPATLYDNPDPEFVRKYEAQLLSKPEHIRRAMLYGDWYHTPGSYFGDAWSNRTHTCRPFKIPDDWPQFRAMDWGFKLPGCVYWIAMDPDYNMVVHREHTFQGKDARVVAGEIRDIEKSLGLWDKRKDRSMVTGPADTQLWEQRGDVTAKTKAQEMAALGVSWVRANKKSRARAAQLLLSRMEDHGGGTKQPGVMFFDTCRNIIRYIPSVPADPSHPEEPLDQTNDHWLDAIMYACSYASLGGVGMARRDDDDDRHDERLDRLAAASRFGYGSTV